jgi:proteasome assembly chaperone (PAC2) family protein
MSPYPIDKKTMNKEDIRLQYVPITDDAIFIACFDGWGNALEVSMGMGEFLIRSLKAQPFGEIIGDPFYLTKEKRPIISVKDGIMKNLVPARCKLYVVPKERAGRDVIIMIGDEPDLQWSRFTHCILTLCGDMGIKTIVSCGGLQDNILPTDMIISAFASSQEILDALGELNATMINYSGPSSIHSSLHFEAKQQGFDTVGLYGHCPYYLQGIKHFGLISHMGSLLSKWAGLTLDTGSLLEAWQDLNKQIQNAIKENQELKDIVSGIRKGRTQQNADVTKSDDKIINLKDYLQI